MIAEIIAEVVGYTLLTVPGVFIRWLWFGRRKKFIDVVDEDTVYNVLLSILLIVAVVIAVIFIF